MLFLYKNRPHGAAISTTWSFNAGNKWARVSFFSQTVGRDYETGLIELYKRAGLSVKGSHNYKALLVDFALLHAHYYNTDEKLQMLEAKVHALLEDMSPEDIQEMVNHRQYRGIGSVLEILSEKEGSAARLLEKLIRSYVVCSRKAKF